MLLTGIKLRISLTFLIASCSVAHTAEAVPAFIAALAVPAPVLSPSGTGATKNSLSSVITMKSEVQANKAELPAQVPIIKATCGTTPEMIAEALIILP